MGWRNSRWLDLFDFRRGPYGLRMKKSVARWLEPLSLVALLNLDAFNAVGMSIGGFAETKDGHYFVANHGKLTEVSHWIYLYSVVHFAITLQLTAAVVCIWSYLGITDKLYESKPARKPPLPPQ